MGTSGRPSGRHSLTRAEARHRAELVSVDGYEISLDLTGGETTFGSRTTVRFSSAGGETFVDLAPVEVVSLTLDGHPIRPELVANGRLPLALGEGAHELVADLVMPYRHDGEGMHRTVDPADGRHYAYAMCFMDAAPTVFACFDQPDLKAPVTLDVRAPRDWVVVGNARGAQVEPGLWCFATTQPLSTYLVTVVAGPYHVVRAEHDGIALGLSARASLARDLDRDAEDLLTVTGQCFDEFHRLFGIRYQFGDYHQAFVPEFNAGAMESAGCVLFRDPLVFSSKVTHGIRIGRAVTVAHELAHQWFGNLTTPVWWDDLWLNESFAEYLGVRVAADVTSYADAWVNDAYSRRQWGLVADRRPSTHPVAGTGAQDAATALQDFDGISYAKGSALLKQLNLRLGDDVFLHGVVDHLRAHWFGNATMTDLFEAWERAGAVDLSAFADSWLRVAGVDTLTLERADQQLRLHAPEQASGRGHVVRVARAEPGHPFQLTTVEVGAEPAAYPVGDRTVVVIDPFEDTWAVPHLDPATVAGLGPAMASTRDPALRAGLWNGLASTFHDGELAPESYVDVVAAAIPTEDNDDAFTYRLPDVVERAAWLAGEPTALLDRLHAVLMAKLGATEPGSSLQLGVLLAAAGTCRSSDLLGGWLAGAALPEGAELDVELRWALLVRMARLGVIDRAGLARQYADQPTAAARVYHVMALASLPDAEAKEFAWSHLTGETPASNYEIAAAGRGMWRPDQLALTQPYVTPYFDLSATLSQVHDGWTLAESAESFFPITSLTADTVAATRTALAAPGLAPAVHRVLVDRCDELERRLLIMDRYAR